MSAMKSPKELSATDTEKKNKIVVEDAETEELLPGWTKELKTRKAGSKTKIDRYYTDPVTGYIFRSLKDAQRYLKTGELGRLAIKPKNNSENASNPSGRKMVEMSGIKLQDSIGMEESEEKSPMSENLRHKRPLENGSEGYKTRSRSSETNKSELTQRASKRLAGIKIDAPPPPPSPPEPKTRQATRQSGIKIDTTVPSPPPPKTRQARRLAGIETGASPPSLPQPKTRQAIKLAGIKIDSPPEPRTSRQDTAKRATEAETRTTVYLATREENVKKTEEMQVEFAGEIIEKDVGNAAMDDKPNHNQENAVLLPPVTHKIRDKVNKVEFEADAKQKLHTVLPPATPTAPEEHYKEIEMRPAVEPPVSHPTPEAQPPPAAVPPANSGMKLDDYINHHKKQESADVNPPVTNSCYGGDMKPESSTNFSLNDLWTDPCIEFAVKTLTGAIPFGDLNKSDNFPATPLEVPFEELWSDPCIEFAVKTLTGAIPVGEDADHCVQDYLRHQNGRTSETHGFSLADDVGMNFCQTEVLSKHFETSHNNNNKQQDSVGPNGGLQKSGSNGQCSRPRLFD